jgi:hypothetical protein
MMGLSVSEEPAAGSARGKLSFAPKLKRDAAGGDASAVVVVNPVGGDDAAASAVVVNPYASTRGL